MVINAFGKEPPNTPFVSLSAALTWLAFRHSLDASELRAAVIGEPVTDKRNNEERLRDFFLNDETEAAAYGDHGIGPFHDREPALALLAQAWAVILSEADRGSCEVRGRYTPLYSSSEAHLANVEVLTGSRLGAFSQFDISTGGIRRQPFGQPTVIWEGHSLVSEREWIAVVGAARAREGYLMVEVPRVALSQSLMPEAAYRMTYEQVVAWCRKWIRKGCGNGMDKAWAAFQAEPAHAGLTRDDVFRPAWREAKKA